MLCECVLLCVHVLDIPQPAVIILALCRLFFFYQAVIAACFIQACYRKPQVNDHAIHGNQLTLLDSTSKAALTLVNYSTSGQAFPLTANCKDIDSQQSAINKGKWFKKDLIICYKEKLPYMNTSAVFEVYKFYTKDTDF